MKYLTRIFAACIVLLASSQMMAASGKQNGTASGMQLLISPGAQGSALSGAHIALVGGIDALFWNPAGSASLKSSKAEVMVSHQKYFADIGVTYIAAIAKLGGFGNLGFAVKTLSMGDIVETTVESPEGTGSVFSPNYMTVSGHYSKKFTDRIQFGLNAKIVSEKIMSVSASAFALDLGLQYVNPTGFKVGLVLANYGTGMNYSGQDLELRHQLPGTEAGSTQGTTAVPAAKNDLPTQLKIGLGYDIKVAEKNQLSIMATFVNNSKAYNQYIAGLEYSYNKTVYLRGAYSTAFKEGIDEESSGFMAGNQDYVWGPSFGGGVRLGMGSGMSLIVDYAYQTTEFFDNVQWFSFVFGL